MLSRTADHLFWMARYMERAENTARMLDVNYQTSLLPQSADRAELGWAGVLGISVYQVFTYTQAAELVTMLENDGEDVADETASYQWVDPEPPEENHERGTW